MFPTHFSVYLLITVSYMLHAREHDMNIKFMLYYSLNYFIISIQTLKYWGRRGEGGLMFDTNVPCHVLHCIEITNTERRKGVVLIN